MNCNRFMKRSLSLGLTFAVFMTTAANAASLGMVTASGVNIRNSNSTEAAVISKADNGEQINVISDLDGWFKISSPDGSEAYVTSQFVKITQADGTVNSQAVNIRTSPSTDAEVAGQATTGDLLSVSGVAGDWYEVLYNGSKAYVHKDFLNGNLLKYVPESTAAANSSSSSVYALVNCAGGLNLRSNASTSANVVKLIPNGTSLDVIDVSGEWVQVKDDSGSIGYVSSQYVTLNSGTKPANKASAKADEIIAFAKNFIGTPYVYGGTSLTSGVDCSGFVYAVFDHFGTRLSRSSRAQYSDGTFVDKTNLATGDLVFFNTGGNSAISHVGIYIGNGQYIHSTDGGGKGVTISSLSSSYSAKTYYGACRVLK